MQKTRGPLYIVWLAYSGLAYALRGITTRANNWALFFAAALGAAADWAGGKVTYTDGWAGTLVAALATAGAALFVIFLIRLLISPLRIWKIGVWRDGVFVFNERTHVYTDVWKPEDNGRAKTFRSFSAPPYSLVRYRIDVDGPSDRISRTLGPPFMIANSFSPGTGEMRASKTCSFELRCHSQPGTDPAIVRVYFLGWRW